MLLTLAFDWYRTAPCLAPLFNLIVTNDGFTNITKIVPDVFWERFLVNAQCLARADRTTFAYGQHITNFTSSIIVASGTTSSSKIEYQCFPYIAR